jgi:2-polyprenyl-3-methyl-5-hydroxy-6-metoxy-1,4-benzoquinol methylase
VKAVRTVSEADLARLKQARDEADRRYNEALSELDAAIQALPTYPQPPPPPDETQMTALNERWAITRAVPAPAGGWRGRLGGFVLGLLRPALDQQEAFNATLVDHLNRNLAVERAVPEAIAATLDVLRQQLDLLVQFESRLIVFLQQLTPYVDTKDYEFNGLATRINEDALVATSLVSEAHDLLDRTVRPAVRGLAASLSEVSDDVLKRWERYEGLRTSVGTLQLTIQALKREAARVPVAPAVQGKADDAATPAAPRAAPAPSSALSTDPLSSYKYVAFEDLFRGDRKVIRARQEDYVALFAKSRDVLDVGCGRGEFLQLLAERGITARGIDLNHEMVQQCLAAGLDVTEADALSYLRQQPDESLGGLIAAQVVEHLEPDYLLAFVDEAFRVLRPGSAIALETINVASWSAFFTSYLRDITHAQPVHPDTLKFIVTASGFGDAEIRLRAPLPESEMLLASPRVVRDVDLRTTGVEGRAVLELADAFDRNVERLNTQLYAPLDYVVIAWKR